MSDLETRRVPLFLKSSLSVVAWLVLGLILLGMGAMCILLGLTMERMLGMVGAALTLLGVAAGCRGVAVLTTKVRLAPDHIARVTAFSRRKIAWEDVEVCSLGLWMERPPHHARFRIEGRDGAIRFRTRPEDYADLAAELRACCRSAFLHDAASGRITPPAGDPMAGQIAGRFRRHARRAARRHALLAVGQAALLPALLLLAGLKRFGPKSAVVALPFGPADIPANLRRARAAGRSLREYLGGRAGGHEVLHRARAGHGPEAPPWRQL